MFKLEAILHVIATALVIIGIVAHLTYYKIKDKKNGKNFH
jgi:hypothetical protein